MGLCQPLVASLDGFFNSKKLLSSLAYKIGDEIAADMIQEPLRLWHRRELFSSHIQQSDNDTRN